MKSPVEQDQAGRAMLARWMQGHWQEDDGVPGDAAIDASLRLAWAEGVTALVERGLGQCPDAPAPLREAFGRAARAAAMAAMMHEAECRQVLDRLAANGIPVLLLKGSALGHWLYPAPYLRECSDIDLMVDGLEQMERAADALAGLGYATIYRPGSFGHTWLCARPLGGGGRIEIDLHRRLADMPLFGEKFGFDELHAASFPVAALGAHAFALSPAHALLHACVHRVSNIVAGIGDRLKWLYEIHLLSARLEEEDWRQVDRIAGERGLCGICVAALERASDYFGPAAPNAWLDRLCAGAAGEVLDVARLSDWKYMQRQNLAALPSMRARARWLWHRLFPSAGYLHAIYGEPLGTWAAFRLRMRRLMRRLRD